MNPLRELDYRIIELVDNYSPLTLPELARLLGASRSWTWKRVKALEKAGLVRTEKRGRTLLVFSSGSSYRAEIRVGILRASEYPYILPLAGRLRERYGRVKILVYDEAFRLATDLAGGRVHLAMAPLVTLLAVHRLSGGKVHIIGGGSRGGSGIIYSPNGGTGHATTMASTMELCAEVKRLPGPRVYMRSGSDILKSVVNSRVGAGVIWEPYLSEATKLGLATEDCGLPFCCVLGANKALEREYHRIGNMMEEAIGEAERGRVDLASYARLIGFPKEVVEATVRSYGFLYEPPVREAEALFEHITRTITPRESLRQAFRVGP